MEEGKNEIMELRQMIEGCFERQNKLIARLEMELEALSNFNGKQMLDSRDMRLQLKVCDRTLIRWRMSGKLPSFKISGKVYFWAFDVYKFLREEYGTIVLPEALEEEEPITINNKKNGKSKKLHHDRAEQVRRPCQGTPQMPADAEYPDLRAYCQGSAADLHAGGDLRASPDDP